MENFLMTAGRGGIEDLVLPPLPRDSALCLPTLILSTVTTPP